MEIDKLEPPRVFEIGAKNKIEISHTANIQLDTNEQITLVAKNGSEVDVVKKEWGYYLTPSINKRLMAFELTTFLVQNSRGNIFVMSVEEDGLEDFHDYLEQTNQKVIINLSDIYCVS
jgi:hypothetical protein